MSHSLYIRATVEGEEFFYAETHEWRHLNDPRAIDWFNNALIDLNQVAAKEASKGTGSLRVTLVQQWDNEEPLVVEYDNFSYKDMVKVQKEFLKKYKEIVEISEKRNK